MRRGFITLTVVLLILMLAVGVFAAGCGGTKTDAQAQTTVAGGSSSQTTAAQNAASAPADILKQAFSTAPTMTSGSGQFDLSVALNGDTSQLPEETKALFGQPISISGTIAANEKPLALDLAVTANFAGQKLPLGMKMVDGKAWINLMDQWYEAPAELMEGMSTATTLSATTPSSMLEVLKTAGVDPTTWLKDLKQVGEEDLNGTKTLHMSGAIDITKMLADVMKLSQDKSIQGMIPGAGTTDSSTAVSLPSATELAEIQKQVEAMFQNMTVDVWVTKEGYEFRKAGFAAKVVLPAEQSIPGVTDVALTGSFTMAPATAAVTVTPPAAAKSAEEFTAAVGSLSMMFSGLLGGGTGMGTDTTVVQ